MWKEIPPFSFSAGERKIMAHFVVRCLFLLWLRRSRAGIFVVKTTSASADVATHLPQPVNNPG